MYDRRSEYVPAVRRVAEQRGDTAAATSSVISWKSTEQIFSERVAERMYTYSSLVIYFTVQAVTLYLAKYDCIRSVVLGK